MLRLAQIKYILYSSMPSCHTYCAAITKTFEVNQLNVILLCLTKCCVLSFTGFVIIPLPHYRSPFEICYDLLSSTYTFSTALAYVLDFSRVRKIGVQKREVQITRRIKQKREGKIRTREPQNEQGGITLRQR